MPFKLPFANLAFGFCAMNTLQIYSNNLIFMRLKFRAWIVKMDKIEGADGDLACTFGCKALFDTGFIPFHFVAASARWTKEN